MAVIGIFSVVRKKIMAADYCIIEKKCVSLQPINITKTITQ